MTSTNAHMRAPSAPTRARDVFLKPLAAHKSRVVWIILALAVLSLSQGLFLLMVKGFVTALFAGGGEQAAFSLAELLPAAVVERLPFSRSVTVAHSTLAWSVPACLLVAAMTRAAAMYVYQLNQQALALGVACRYRESIFAAVMKQPYERLAASPAGEWMSLVMNDALYLQTRFSDIMTGFVRDGVLILTGLAVIYLIHVPSAVVLTVAAPLVAAGMGRTGKRISRYAEAFQKELARLAGTLLDLRGRFDFIRAQGGEAREKKRFVEMNEAYYRMVRRSILVRSAFAPTLEFFGFLLFAGFVYAAGRGLLGIDMTPAIMMQFFVALGIMLKPLRNLGEQAGRYHETKGTVQRSLAAVRQLTREARDQVSEICSPENAPSKADVRLERVKAGVGERVLFSGRELTIRPGAAVALVGPSGAGKSTFVKTLAGLLEPIEWVGEPSWLATAGLGTMVSQHPFLFDATVRENLIYGLSPENVPSTSGLWQALAAVGMDEDVKRLPQGLETPVRPVGSNLSGGQVQRLAIARALVRPGTYLWLDEATSAVDARTERLLTERLVERCRREGLGLLAVTHRLAWLDQFDTVWFAEEGEVRLQGPHAQLMNEPRYRRFVGGGQDRVGM